MSFREIIRILPIKFALRSGRRVVLIPHKKTLRLLIVPLIEQAEGFLKGIDTDLQREGGKRKNEVDSSGWLEAFTNILSVDF